MIETVLSGRSFLLSRFKGLFVSSIPIAGKKYDVRIFDLNKLTITCLKSHKTCNKTSNIFDRVFENNILFHKRRIRREMVGAVLNT